MATRTPTDVWFQTDKNGKPIAYRWSRKQHCSFRISLDKAVFQIATGQARLLDSRPF